MSVTFADSHSLQLRLMPLSLLFLSDFLSYYHDKGFSESFSSDFLKIVPSCTHTSLILSRNWELTQAHFLISESVLPLSKLMLTILSNLAQVTTDPVWPAVCGMEAFWCMVPTLTLSALVGDRGCVHNLPVLWHTYAYWEGFQFVQGSNFAHDSLHIPWVDTIWMRSFCLYSVPVT